MRPRKAFFFNFYMSKIICKRLELNSEPTHFLTFMDSGKAFPSLDGMACSYQCLSFYQGNDKPKCIGFLETLKNQTCQKITLMTPGIIRSLKLKTKKRKHNFVELLIPTLNKGVNHWRGQTMNNHHKIISLHGAPPESMVIFFQKTFSWGNKGFGQKFMRRVL